MYSFPSLEPVRCSIFSFNCCFLTCIQISQEAGWVVWYSHLFKNLPQFVAIHTVKGFGVVNKAKLDVFLELSCFFDDPVDAGNLMSGSSAFSKSSLNIWKFSVHLLLKPSLENFEHYFASINTMKRQKDTTLKDELPRLVDAQCATGGKQTNSSKRCEKAEPKQKQPPVMDVSGGGSKV